MFCRECKEENRTDAAFCNSYGAKTAKEIIPGETRFSRKSSLFWLSAVLIILFILSVSAGSISVKRATAQGVNPPRYIPPGPEPTLSVYVESVPDGADFYINGTPEGKTDGTIDLPGGFYTIELDKTGYQTYFGTFTVDPSTPCSVTPCPVQIILTPVISTVTPTPPANIITPTITENVWYPPTYIQPNTKTSPVTPVSPGPETSPVTPIPPSNTVTQTTIGLPMAIIVFSILIAIILTGYPQRFSGKKGTFGSKNRQKK